MYSRADWPQMEMIIQGKNQPIFGTVKLPSGKSARCLLIKILNNGNRTLRLLESSGEYREATEVVIAKGELLKAD
jgi:hypothetical protein